MHLTEIVGGFSLPQGGTTLDGCNDGIIHNAPVSRKGSTNLRWPAGSSFQSAISACPPSDSGGTGAAKMRDGEGNDLTGKVYREYRTPAAVLLLGLLSVLLLVWTYLIGERQGKLFAWADATMDMRVNAAMYHLWFEEAAARGSREDAGKAFSYLDESLMLSDAILSGGKSEHGSFLPRLDEPGLRRHGEIIRSHLLKLKELGLERQRDLKAAGIGSPLDVEFNAVFREFDAEARFLETFSERKWESDQAKTGRLQFFILVAWILIIAASAVGLSRHERRRRRAEAALGLAYDEMEQRVTVRTAELSNANLKLQEEIAERERAEVSLKMSEGEYRRLSAQFRTLLDTIPAPITLVSPGLKVMWANKVASALSLPHPASPLHCYEARHDRSAPCSGCPAEKSLQTGKAENARMITPDGRHWDIRTVPVVK